jgi:hypothetical protein
MATKTPDVIYAEEEKYNAYKAPTINVPKLEYTESTPTYGVDYNNEQFQKVEADKQDALTENSQVYGDMIAGADKFYQDLKDQHMAWADKQAQIQQENTDFTIEKIEQQKEQAQKDYLKEQSGAYVDWQKQSNRYGVEAERQASAGLDGSGYSESSQVAMYNTYQIRVATARETLSKAKLNYDNNIKEAMLQNNAALAEIYANAYLKQAELALEGFQYKNQLVLDQANKKLEIDQMYYNRWQDVLQQINTENAMAEDIRQFNESMKLDVQKANANNQLTVALKQLEISFNDYQAYIEREFEKKMLNAKTQAEKDILAQEQANALAKIEKERQEQEKLLKYQYDLKNQSVGTVTGTTGNKTTSQKPSAKTYAVTKDGAIGSSVKNTASKNPPLNMQSVVNAFGPISEAQLAKYVDEGKARMYVKNGQMYVKKINSVNRIGIQGVNVPKTQTKSPISTPLSKLRNTLR